MVSCISSKKVKSHPVDPIDNSNIEIVVPLTVKQPLPSTQDSTYSFESTTTIAIILGTIVTILSFLPLFIMYTTLAFTYIKELVCKLYNRYK